MDGCRVTLDHLLRKVSSDTNVTAARVQFHRQRLAIYDHFHLQRLTGLFRANLVQGVFTEMLTRVLASLLHHSDGTLLLGSLLATYRSSRLVTLTSATSWLLTMVNTFDVAHFATTITLGRAEWTLGGSVAVLATPKTNSTEVQNPWRKVADMCSSGRWR